jgi:predicted DCC family thiol-disulfide oxidoreductase YuxK
MSKPTLLYNGSCPVCRKEIEHYRRLDRGGDGALCFQDITSRGFEVARGEIDLETTRKRLHVVDGDGRVIAGVPAFARIWEELPRYRWLGTLVRLLIIRTLAASLYAPVAQLLYAMDRRRRRRSCERARVSAS